jgi:hypothetical protein
VGSLEENLRVRDLQFRQNHYSEGWHPNFTSKRLNSSVQIVASPIGILLYNGESFYHAQSGRWLIVDAKTRAFRTSATNSRKRSPP